LHAAASHPTCPGFGERPFRGFALFRPVARGFTSEEKIIVEREYSYLLGGRCPNLPPSRFQRISSTLGESVNPGAADSSFPLFLTRLRAAKASVRTCDKDASDAELLVALEAGNYAALEPLFDRYAALIFGIGLRTLHDRGEAEDLVQDFFLHLCEKAKGFDSLRGSARSWIIQIAYRRAFDRRSYLCRRKFYDGTDVDGLANTAFGDGDAALEALLAADELRTGLAELTDKQRMTLRLFFFDGLDFREISERLSETVENTRHHYYRGLERLRRCIAAQSRQGRD